MTTPATPELSEPKEAARSQLRLMMEGFEKTQLLYVAARLGLADLLSSGVADVERLAAHTGVEPTTLYRLMRALAWCGVVRHAPDDTFALTALGECLRADVDDSLHDRIVCIGDLEYPAWGALLYAVRSGGVAFDHVFGAPFYEHLRAHPDVSANFHRLMGKGAVDFAQAIVRAYDFSDLGTLVDIGGGDGTLLTTILHANPHLHGVVFDTPAVIGRAEQRSRESGLHPRLRTVGGDFLAAIPPDGDAYFMQRILHNWDDELCVRVLETCRRTMAGRGSLLIVEFVMPARNDPATSVSGLDLCMMVCLGARERTEAEYRALLGRAGFEWKRTMPTSAGVSIIEALPSTRSGSSEVSPALG